ncbi:EAL domain-containing protein [Spiribacter insolitus]|uniref:EAL domain-containing protein n=1 Tax=Spiribacter insolitus TaxID=3122417 RepID=A0ABV3T609_9GAMM
MDNRDSGEKASQDTHRALDAALLAQAIRYHIGDTLPAATSNIPLDICIEVAVGHERGKSLTMKQLIYELPYSEAGIHYHLHWLCDEGWLRIQQGQEDRRVRNVLPDERLIEALDRFQTDVLALMADADDTGPPVTVGSMREAIDRGLFFLVYQPVFSPASGDLIGAEALLRWRSDDGHIIAPEAFVPLAQKFGMIGGVTRMVLERVCLDVSRLQSLDERFGLSMNLTASDLRSDWLLNAVEEAARDGRLVPGLVTFELTEAEAMELTDEDIDACARLQAYGIGFAMDDWRIGEPHPTTHHQPFSRLKLDVSWVENLVADSDKRALVERSVREAHAAEMEVFAEGVEDPCTLEVLREAGCEAVQGYLFGRPLPLDDFIRFHGPK